MPLSARRHYNPSPALANGHSQSRLAAQIAALYEFYFDCEHPPDGLCPVPIPGEEYAGLGLTVWEERYLSCTDGKRNLSRGQRAKRREIISHLLSLVGEVQHAG